MSITPTDNNYVESQYKALANFSGSYRELAKLSWLAIGIYLYLVYNSPATIEQLGKHSPSTPYAQISNALDELIALGLVAEEKLCL